jgi:hypothetical protein
MMVKIVILLFFLLLIFLMLRQGRKYKDFIAASDKTFAIIVNKEEVAKRADQPHRKEYVIAYSYQVNGVDYMGRGNVEYQDLWLDMQEGQQLEIYYLRENPKQSYPVLILDRRVKLSTSLFR